MRALFPPENLMVITNALEANGFTGMFISPVDGKGKQKPSSFFQCDSLRKSDLLPRIQLDMVVDYCQADDLIGTIVETCRIEYIDVHVFVLPGEKSIQIQKEEVFLESPAGDSFVAII
ncbi:P-II family nitrogen regulator [Methanoregula sp.]|uniref:P-II family nitrogen regulator n=1 Tax=Methanoregula sp. TaxID=2052170 RepID=UPI0025D096A5|nr:P-II family nitrogen regulator [Methanoregula sp.]